MKNIILLILFLIITFVLNIVFYYNSSDYRMFLKWLKSSEVVEKEEGDLVNIKQKLEEQKEVWKQKEEKEKKEEVEIKYDEPEKEEDIKKVKEVKLWKNYLDILKLFSKYELEALEINTNLFDITNEYPDNFFEYYSRDLTLYFFPTKNYWEVLEIFEVLELELPFSLNKANNFWTKSFYINLDENIDDSIVRIVIEHNNITFWLKIKKNEYNNIKKILEKLK